MEMTFNNTMQKVYKSLCWSWSQRWLPTTIYRPKTSFFQATFKEFCRSNV